MEAETQSWAEYAPQAEFDFTAPVVYSRAPSSLSYGLDPSLRIERSELVHRQVDASSVVYEDENFDPSSEEPIKYLVLTGDITATFEFLHIIKGRLRRDSTLCFLQPGVGFFERINKEIFPDPRTRPGYVLLLLPPSNSKAQLLYLVSGSLWSSHSNTRSNKVTNIPAGT